MTTTARPATPPLTAFAWGDTAVGGPSHRNKVRDLTAWQPPDHATDAYATILRFTSDLADYAGGHTSRSGVCPSVEDYAGVAHAPKLWFDYDAEENVERALDDARGLVRGLQARFDLNPDACQVYFTGAKGFAVEIPMIIFGGSEPAPCGPLARRIRRLARVLTDGLATWDETVYDPLRLWRYPNTRNSKTGRYKIPLTSSELLTLDIAAIRERATRPRPMTFLPDDEWLPNPDLIEVWQSVAAEPERPQGQGAGYRGRGSTARPPSDDRWRQAVEMLADAWPASGKRHAAALALCGGLMLDGWNEDAAGRFLCAVAAAAMGEEGARRTQEWLRVAATTSARLEDGMTTTGWTTLHGLVGTNVVMEARYLLGLAARVAPGDHDGGDGLGGPPKDGTPGTHPTDTAPVRFQLTDLGNAEALQHRYGPRLQYVVGWGWLVYDGKRWATDAGDLVVNRAMQLTVRAMLRDAKDIEDADQRAALAKHALASERTSRVQAAVTAARSLRGMSARMERFDRDPFLLGTANGAIDLRSGELRAHDRDDYLTRLAPVHYDPNARSPVWERFLDTATGGDREYQAFLARAVGYTLTGDTREEKLFFVHGPTNSGKSTFADAIKAVLGDYAATADFETFLARRDVGGVRDDIARLAGARLVASIETDAGRRLAAGLVKMLVGGDAVTARQLYQSAFTFTPRFKLWLVANDAPQVREDDGAMWRRLLRLPFDVVIPEGERDPAVKATLRDVQVAGPAILAWAVRGCLEWQRVGLQIPERIRQATAAYRTDMDPLRAFISECCVEGADRWVTSAALWEAYQTFAKGDRQALSRKGFGEALERRGHTGGPSRIAGKVTRIWRGIGLVDSSEGGGTTV